jgi:hypothetical protein
MSQMTVEKENTGVIFENDSENEKAPQFSGVINVNGEQLRIALWEKEGKNGGRYLSAAISPYEAPSNSGSGSARSGSSNGSRGQSNGGGRFSKPSRR